MMDYNKLMEDLENCLGLESATESVVKSKAAAKPAFEEYDEVERELATELGVEVPGQMVTEAKKAGNHVLTKEDLEKVPAESDDKGELIFDEQDEGVIDLPAEEPAGAEAEEPKEVFVKSLKDFYNSLNMEPEEAMKTINEVMAEVLNCGGCEENFEEVDPEEVESEEVEVAEEATNKRPLTKIVEKVKVIGPRVRGAKYPSFDKFSINESKFPDEMRMKSYEISETPEGEVHFDYTSQGDFTDVDFEAFEAEVTRAFTEVANSFGYKEPFTVIFDVKSRDNSEKYKEVVIGNKGSEEAEEGCNPEKKEAEEGNQNRSWDEAFEEISAKMLNRYKILANKNGFNTKDRSATEATGKISVCESAITQTSCEFNYSGENLKKMVIEAIQKGVI